MVWDKEDCIKEARNKLVVRDAYKEISHDSEPLIILIHASLLNSEKSKKVKIKLLKKYKVVCLAIPFFCARYTL